jgi:hypothetical protein
MGVFRTSFRHLGGGFCRVPCYSVIYILGEVIARGLAAFSYVVHEPIYARDGFKRGLADSGRAYLSAGIPWLTFLVMRAR